MSKFYYKSQGSVSEHPSAGVIEADSEGAALKTLDQTYSIKRDKGGRQTNADLITVELIELKEFELLEDEHGEDLTHRIGVK